MAEYTHEELMAKVLEVLTTKDKMKNKEIATILDVKKKEVDLAVNDLAKEGKSIIFITHKLYLLSFLFQNSHVYTYKYTLVCALFRLIFE